MALARALTEEARGMGGRQRAQDDDKQTVRDNFTVATYEKFAKVPPPPHRRRRRRRHHHHPAHSCFTSRVFLAVPSQVTPHPPPLCLRSRDLCLL
eukprot:2596-Rhodomonas_salina.1